MNRLLSLALTSALTTVLAAPGCSRETPGLEIGTGSNVTLEKKDGVTIAGRLVEVRPEYVIVETPVGARTEVRRADITSLRAEAHPPIDAGGPPTQQPLGNVEPPRQHGGGPPPTPAPEPSTVERGAERPTERAPRRDRGPEYKEVTLPAGTVLAVELTSAVGSDTSRLEDPVRATLRRPVTVDGIQAVPAGAAVLGTVTGIERSGRVRGRARVALRFTSLHLPGSGERVAIRTATLARAAPATAKRDAATIGGGAVGGAIIGGIVGGGDGAAKGAAIGGAAGTGVVVSTRGKEVRLGPGVPLSLRLTAPVTLRIRTES